METNEDVTSYPTSPTLSSESDNLDRTWRWYFIEPPEYAHTQAMLRASPIRKGVYRLCPITASSAGSLPGSHIPPRPDHTPATPCPGPAPTGPPEAAHRSPSPDEFDREHTISLDSSLLHVDKASIPPKGTRLAVPFHDTLHPRQGCFESRLGLGHTPVENKDYYAQTAAQIYIAGQIRIGPARCKRCRENEITRESDGDFLTHVNSPVPFCTTARQYHHGICAPCFSEGGTLEEMLERCTLARVNTWEEYQALNQADPGSLGQEVFVFLGKSGDDDDDDELKTAQAWIFEADV